MIPDLVAFVADVNASVILLLRLYALYFHNKKVLVAIAVVGVCAMAGAVYVMGRSLSVMGGKYYHSYLHSEKQYLTTQLRRSLSLRTAR